MGESIIEESSMRDCQNINKELVAFLYGELGPEDKRRVKSHLDRCTLCQQELKQLKQVKEESESFKNEIAMAMSTVDWEALPIEMAGRIFKKESVRSRWGHRLFGFLFPVRWKPLYAGLLAGLLVGSLATYFLLQLPQSRETQRADLVFTTDFLDKAELELARRETLEYLEKSQYLLLDFIQPPSGEMTDLWKDETGPQKARELLSKKKFINAQLDKFQMAKAKEICDQIEFLFYELTQLSGHLSPEELKRLQNLIEEKQLMLKIKLVKNELKKSEV